MRPAFATNEAGNNAGIEEPSMLDSELYDLTQSLGGALAAAMGAVRKHDSDQPAPPPILQLRAGYAESPGWFLVQAAEFDPEPLTVEKLRVRDIYASESLVAALLEIMASEGWLDRRGSAYFLTPKGHAMGQRILENRRRWMAGVVLPAGATELSQQLGDLINRSLQAPEPPGTWCLAHSRNRAPAADAGPLHQLWHTVSDFNAFRDDAHMAAWRPLDLEGYEWEAFSLVAGEQAVTAERVYSQLAHRGYSVSDYASALEKLAGRGLLQAAANGHLVAGDGRKVLSEVEQDTDTYFYMPWNHLSAAEVRGLRDLLVIVRDGLTDWAQTQ